VNFSSQSETSYQCEKSFNYTIEEFSKFFWKIGDVNILKKDVH